MTNVKRIIKREKRSEKASPKFDDMIVFSLKANGHYDSAKFESRRELDRMQDRGLVDRGASYYEGGREIRRYYLTQKGREEL